MKQSSANHENPVPNAVTNLRKLRKRKKLTQAKLANDSGVSMGVISRLELAESHEEIDGTWAGNLIVLAGVLGTTAVRVYPRLGEVHND